MIRPIAISLSPNIENRDVLQAVKLLFSPRLFFRGDSIRLLEYWFRRYFSVSFAISFASGRGALYAILKAANIIYGDEVLLQAFTCVAVPNAIIVTGALPVYVDITDSLTINPTDLEKKITKKTKVIIVQHTFGIPSDMKTILAIAKKYKLLVIEDCAHTIGGEYKGKKLGTFGDAAIFSFGRDKSFSSVFGGIAMTNNTVLGNKIRQFQRKQKYPGFLWIAQQLFHPIAFFVILPIYNLFLGKVFLFFLQKLKFLSFPVLSEEKQGKSVPIFTGKFPNALACLALEQLMRLDTFNKTRETISQLYAHELQAFYSLAPKETMPLLRFPLLVEKREEIISALKRQGVYIGKWYSEIIDPKGVDFKKLFYKRGSCPNAEYIATKIINLPTYPTMTLKEAKIVVDLVKKYARNRNN